MKVTAALLLGCYVTLCSPHITNAEPITIQFAGVVTEGFGELGYFGAGVIEPGTPFSGSFTYDPAKAYLPPELADINFIYVDDPAGTMTIRLGTLAASTDGGIGFRADSGAVFSRGFAEPPMFPFRQDLGVTLFLGNGFPYAVPAAQTLAGAFDPSRARFRMSLFPHDDDPSADLFGDLRSLTVDDVAPVPEPATVMLVGTGILFVAHRRRTAARLRKQSTYSVFKDPESNS